MLALSRTSILSPALWVVGGGSGRCWNDLGIRFSRNLPALQGGLPVPTSTPQPGRFGLAAGGLSTLSRVNPQICRSTCEACVDASAPKKLILSELRPHSSIH